MLSIHWLYAFKNHANLLTCMPNWTLYTLEKNAKAFFSQALFKPPLCTYTVWWTAKWARRLHNYVHGTLTIRLLTPLYLLSTLSITYILNYSMHSPAILYGKHQKDGRGLGMSLVTPQWNHSTHKSYANYSHSVHSQPTTRGRVQTFLSTNILRLHFKGCIFASLRY